MAVVKRKANANANSNSTAAFSRWRGTVKLGNLGSRDGNRQSQQESGTRVAPEHSKWAVVVNMSMDTPIAPT